MTSFKGRAPSNYGNKHISKRDLQFPRAKSRDGPEFFLSQLPVTV